MSESKVALHPPHKKQKGSGGEWVWPTSTTAAHTGNETDATQNNPEASRLPIPDVKTPADYTAPSEDVPAIAAATTTAAQNEPISDTKTTDPEAPPLSPPKLEATGLLNENRQDKWMENFLELEKAIQEHGTLGVAVAIRGTKLAKWVLNQRMSYKNKEPRMTPERIQLLKQIGFQFTQSASELKWMAKYQDMLDYKEEHGHLNVSKQQYTKHAQLGEWIAHQIRNHNNGKLHPERKDLLLRAGLSLENKKPAAKDWMFRYHQLVEYTQRFGDTNVPKRWPENTQLGSFVFHARKNYQNFLAGKPSRGLNQEKIDLLNQIGFQWRLRDARGTGRRPDHENGGVGVSSDLPLDEQLRRQAMRRKRQAQEAQHEAALAEQEAQRWMTKAAEKRAQAEELMQESRQLGQRAIEASK